RLDEFPAGYSLPGCSSALPVSASPAGVTMLSGQPNSGAFKKCYLCLGTCVTHVLGPKTHEEGNSLHAPFFLGLQSAFPASRLTRYATNATSLGSSASASTSSRDFTG